MKIIKDKTHTYPIRLWYEDGEIEEIVETHRRTCIHTFGKSTDIVLLVDKFIEFYLPNTLGTEIILDPYADLQKTEGSEVLGATDFYEDHLEIKIDRRVTEEAEKTSMWGRYRSTAMHEATHCILHPILFRNDPNQQQLFKPAASKKITCLKRTIDNYYTGEWWEYQANIGMANLLMPKDLFLAHFEMERDAYGIHKNRDLVKNKYVFNAVVGYLVNTFQVSKQAVFVRLKVLKQLPNVKQGELLEEGEFSDDKYTTIGELLLGRE